PCDTKVKPMALIIGVVSQKGGVGKSTIARLIARELAAQDWEVKIAGLDISERTSYHRRASRLQPAMQPAISLRPSRRSARAWKGNCQNKLGIAARVTRARPLRRRGI